MLVAVQRVLVAAARPPAAVAATVAAASPTRDDGDSSRDAARDWLVHALGCAFRALRDPDCAALLGPPVPGATLPLGARVPGTSYELDPASAAFNLGAMIRGPRACAADQVAVLLAAGDYAARRAPYDGRVPPTVGDLFAALHRAQALEHGLAADGECGADPWLCQRVAGAVVAAALLGGDEGRELAAARGASLDGSPLQGVAATSLRQSQVRWAAGENAARALRHALAALREPEPGPGIDAASASPATPPAARSGAGPLAPPLLPPAADADAAAAFAAAVAAVFPAAQAAAIVAGCRDAAALEALGIDAFVAGLVRN